MTYFNPLIAPVAQGTAAQRAAAADKERQIARSQALTKNSAAEGDRFEHAVESADALPAVGDDSSRGGQPHQQQERKQPDDPGKDDAAAGDAHLDVTA